MVGFSGLSLNRLKYVFFLKEVFIEIVPLKGGLQAAGLRPQASLLFWRCCEECQ